jgi:hypothetical protein
MSLFICRWQNGDFSAVSAGSREEAIILLDEVGNAEECELFTVKDFMVHFSLKREAPDLQSMLPVELEGFGEDTHDMLCDHVYPVYKNAVLKAVESEPDDKDIPFGEETSALQGLNAALATERQRQWGAKQPEVSDDPAAAQLQKVIHNYPKAAAERVVKEHRRRQLREMPPPTGKVH